GPQLGKYPRAGLHQAPFIADAAYAVVPPAKPATAMAAPMPVPKSVRRDQEVGDFSAPLGAGVDAEWGSYICPPRRKVPVQEHFSAVSFLGERIGSAALLDQGGLFGRGLRAHLLTVAGEGNATMR